MFRVRITFRNVHDMTNSVTEIPAVRVQLRKWLEMLHSYRWQYVQVSWEIAVHATFPAYA